MAAKAKPHAVIDAEGHLSIMDVISSNSSKQEHDHIHNDS